MNTHSDDVAVTLMCAHRTILPDIQWITNAKTLCPWCNTMQPWIVTLGSPGNGWNWRCVHRGQTGHAARSGRSWNLARVAGQAHANSYGHSVALRLDDWVGCVLTPSTVSLLDHPPF